MTTVWTNLSKAVISLLNIYNKLGTKYNTVGTVYGGNATNTPWTNQIKS